MSPVYATVAQLISYLGELDETEEDLERKLYRASRVIDDVILGAVYSINSLEMPTDPKIIDALKVATIEQVDAWLDGTIPESGIPMYDSVSIGSVRLSGSRGDGDRRPLVAPQSMNELFQAGLIPIAASSYG